MYQCDQQRIRKTQRNFGGGRMKNWLNKRYVLNGCSQPGRQWDGSEYIIQHGEIIRCIKTKWFTGALYKLESDGRILSIHNSIIDRYFDEITEV